LGAAGRTLIGYSVFLVAFSRLDISWQLTRRSARVGRIRRSPDCAVCRSPYEDMIELVHRCMRPARAVR